MVRSVAEGAGDDRVRAATGRVEAEWFALLDAAGATAWTHPAIVAHLTGLGVPSWWRQQLTVRYEQARGMRLPGQKADGTFAVSASRTVDGPLDVAYAAMVSAFATALGGAPASQRESGARPYARWSPPDGSGILVTAEPARDRVRIAAVHERLPDPAALEPAKAALLEVLATLAG
jgi:hypothetical protein